MSAGRLRRVIIESSSDEDEPPSSPRAAETFLSDDDMNSPKTTSRGLFDSFLCPKSEPRGNNHEDSFSNFITDDESENNSISVLEQSKRSVSIADASMRSLPNTPRLQPPRSAKEFLRQPQFFEHSEAIEETSLEDKENVNDESATSEDFEKYLQGLRKQPQDIPSDDENEIDDSEFVVSDDHVSEESGEITDEEEVLELSESESDEKSKPSRPKDVVLLSNLKQAFESPSVKAPRIAKKCSSEWFLQSLADSYNHLRHPDAEQIFRRGVKHVQTRDFLVLKLFTIFRNECFSDKLPEDLKIGWKPRLTKTAGLCSCRLGRAEIWLSTKVCTTPERIRDTLVHEMCHAAVYLIDRVSNHQHGPLWKAWAARCMKRFRSLPLVSRCHDYEINAKFVYVCVGCEQRIHRHSKSLDITRKICGICKGRFVLRTESKAPSAFAVFVQKYYKEEKITGRSHREIMKILSGRFKKSKDRTGEKEEEEEEEIVSQNLDISILSIHE